MKKKSLKVLTLKFMFICDHSLGPHKEQVFVLENMNRVLAGFEPEWIHSSNVLLVPTIIPYYSYCTLPVVQWSGRWLRTCELHVRIPGLSYYQSKCRRVLKGVVRPMLCTVNLAAFQFLWCPSSLCAKSCSDSRLPDNYQKVWMIGFLVSCVCCQTNALFHWSAEIILNLKMAHKLPELQWVKYRWNVVWVMN